MGKDAASLSRSFMLDLGRNAENSASVTHARAQDWSMLAFDVSLRSARHLEAR